MITTMRHDATDHAIVVASLAPARFFQHRSSARTLAPECPGAKRKSI